MDFFKTTIGKVIIVVVILIAAYYIISPLQNCLRDFPGSGNCYTNNSW
jgi:hypothetical protein